MFDKKDPFSWITLDGYRETIAMDFAEARICYERGAYKACQVMLGSVVEACLTYGLQRMRVVVAKGTRLQQLIGQAHACALLPQGGLHLGEAIRDYRNLIHPEKQIEEHRRPDRASARAMMQACEHVLAEVQRRLAGYAPVLVEASLLVEGSVVPVHRLPFTLGRSESNHLAFDISSVSGVHAQIDFQDNRFWLVDRKSVNGTFLLENGAMRRLRPGKPVELRSGMQFRLGKNAPNPEVTFLLDGTEKTTPA